MRKSIILGIFLFTNFLFSQQDPSSQNPSSMSNTASPNAAGFMRFQESPVNHYNGRSNFSIPIYEINVGGIKYPISLNYSQGGIQVNSMASDVGLGWSLTSTFINRTIVGDADLETINDTRQLQQKKKHGYFDFLTMVGGDYDGNQALNEIVDYFPDLFKFVSPTNNSKFYFKNKNSVVELDQKASFIDWHIGNSPHNYLKDTNGNWLNTEFNIQDYYYFDIITKDGIEYHFEDNDISHSFNDYYEPSTHDFGGINSTYPRISSWNVSKIKNMNNSEEIKFTYDAYSSENTHNIQEILSNHPYYRYESICSSATVTPYENNIHYGIGKCNNGGAINKYYTRMLQIQRLKKIEFRGGSVEFNYSSWNRLDLNNGRALTGILVKDNHGNTIKEYELVYYYFQSNVYNGPSNEFSKRLKLLSVQEKGQNKYEFEYYEDQKLPNIGSALQDIFGYCNIEDSDDELVAEPSNYHIPYYFYYPNKSEYSMLPYDIRNDSNHYALVNNQSQNLIDKEPNESSKTWSLKRATLPTGGKTTFVLESNTFDLWGNNLKGGGTRLKQQIIQESEDGQQRIIDYNYKKDAVMTSGHLLNMPQVGYPIGILSATELNSTWLGRYFLLFSNAKINYDLLNNFFVGYSKVEENEDGIKTVYEFSNEEEPNIQTRSSNSLISKFLISNSSYGNDLYIDNSYKRGKLKFIKYYEKNKSNPVLVKENIYSGYTGVETENFPNRHYVFGNANGYNNYEFMKLKKSYNTIYNNLVYTKTTKYLPSGNIEDISNMNYDVYQNLTEVSHKTGNGTTFPVIDLKKYLYPYNLVNPWSQAFEEINKYNIPILIKSYSGEINPANISNPGSQYLTSQSEIKFAKDTNTSSILMPTQALTAIGQNALYEVGRFDRYDSKGNLLQSTKDGLSTTYIYGYKQLYPIAKIEGATYDQVMIALGVPNPTNNSSYLSLDIVKKSDLDKDTTTENDLITALDTFRKHTNLANFRVTTYTYNPLVGVTSVTPPSGMREVYIYEAVTNKLKEVKRMEKDASGTDVYRTLKEYEYHYKPQN